VQEQEQLGRRQISVRSAGLAPIFLTVASRSEAASGIV
jgi:hypothetical protein